jgi:hypothetical protein
MIRKKIGNLETKTKVELINIIKDYEIEIIRLENGQTDVYDRKLHFAQMRLLKIQNLIADMKIITNRMRTFAK